MADFSLAQIGEGATASPRPQQAVAEPSGVQAGLEFATNVGSSIFGAFQDSQAKEQQQQVNQAVTRFASQQMQFAQWVDEGQLSSQEARMRMRNNLIKASADNVNLASEFTKAHEGIISTAGMGKVAAEGTEQEQAFFATQDAATKAGFVLPNMSQDEARLATVKYQQFQNNQAMIQAEANEVGLRRAKIGLQTDAIRQDTARITQRNAQLSLDEKIANKKAKDALAGMADGASFRFNNISRQLEQAVDAGEMPAEEAVRRLDEEWQLTSATAQELGRGVDQTYVNALTSPMEDLYNMRRGYLTGETTRDVLDTRVDMALAKQSAVIASDPETASVLALSRLVDEGAPGMVAAHNNISMRHLSKNSKSGGKSADVTDPEEAESIRPYFETVTNGLDKANTGRLTHEESQEEINNNLNHILDSVGTHGASIESPTELTQAVDLLSSQSYGEYVEKNGPAIDKNKQSQAKTVLQEQYDNVVRPLIAEEWRNASTQVRPERFGPGPGGVDEGDEATTSLIKPFFSGGTLQFISTEERSNSQSQRKIRELNKKVAPVVEKLVRMGAHLEGHRNYQQIYEANYANLFGDAGTGATEE